ncbi:MAG: hypothetical protein J7621_01965 [Niastella sp.]|nr:hypothetical protein [Niastella sp.]
MKKYADQIGQGNFAIDEGTLRVHSGAMDILLQTSKELGLNTDFPVHAKVVIDRGIELNDGDAGVAAAHKGYLQ